MLDFLIHKKYSYIFNRINCYAFFLSFVRVFERNIINNLVSIVHPDESNLSISKGSAIQDPSIGFS